jgi:transcriptional regulator with XRE-family HTH domain
LEWDTRQHGGDNDDDGNGEHDLRQTGPSQPKTGSVAEQMGDSDRALSAYENALRHNPHSLDGLTQVAGIARIRENYSKVRYDVPIKFCFSLSLLFFIQYLPFWVSVSFQFQFKLNQFIWVIWHVAACLDLGFNPSVLL